MYLKQIKQISVCLKPAVFLRLILHLMLILSLAGLLANYAAALSENILFSGNTLSGETYNLSDGRKITPMISSDEKTVALELEPYGLLILSNNTCEYKHDTKICFTGLELAGYNTTLPSSLGTYSVINYASIVIAESRNAAELTLAIDMNNTLAVGKTGQQELVIANQGDSAAPYAYISIGFPEDIKITWVDGCGITDNTIMWKGRISEADKKKCMYALSPSKAGIYSTLIYFEYNNSYNITAETLEKQLTAQEGDLLLKLDFDKNTSDMCVGEIVNALINVTNIGEYEREITIDFECPQNFEVRSSHLAADRAGYDTSEVMQELYYETRLGINSSILLAATITPKRQGDAVIMTGVSYVQSGTTISVRKSQDAKVKPARLEFREYNTTIGSANYANYIIANKGKKEVNISLDISIDKGQGDEISYKNISLLPENYDEIRVDLNMTRKVIITLRYETDYGERISETYSNTYQSTAELPDNLPDAEAVPKKTIEAPAPSAQLEILPRSSQSEQAINQAEPGKQSLDQQVTQDTKEAVKQAEVSGEQAGFDSGVRPGMARAESNNNMWLNLGLAVAILIIVVLIIIEVRKLKEN